VEKVERLRNIKELLCQQRKDELSVLTEYNSSLEKIISLQTSISVIEAEIDALSPTKKMHWSIYLTLMMIPVAGLIYHYVNYVHELTSVYIDENSAIKDSISIWILIFGFSGAISSVMGGLLAAIISNNETLKKYNSFGALLRFWGAALAYYTLFLTGLFFTA